MTQPTTTTELWPRSHEAVAGLRTAASGEPGWRPPAHPSRRRRWMLTAVLALAVLGVAVLLVAQGPGPATLASLNPRNPSANGAQALARVLESQGVRVDVARGQAELDRAGVDGDTTVLVARTGELAPVTTSGLAQLSRTAKRLVVVAPDRTVLRVLSPDVAVTEVRRTERDLVATACGTTDVRAGETLTRSQAQYASSAGGLGCFTADGTSVYLSLPRTATTAPLVLLGSTTALTNDQITNASNAAIVLRILGHGNRVVWYVPNRDDIPTGETGPAALIPPWIGPALVLGAVAFVGVMLWRSRRLGRLVPEPLPVVVRAVETTESRGRLYRRARDASRAALVLQQATRTRLAEYLGLPRPAPSIASRGADQALVTAVAAATGRPDQQVGAILFGPPPTRDDHLLGLAADLAALEKEVHRP